MSDDLGHRRYENTPVPFGPLLDMGLMMFFVALLVVADIFNREYLVEPLFEKCFRH